MLSTGGHGNPEKLGQQRGLRPDANTGGSATHWPLAQPEAQVPPGSQLPPGTHGALGHDIQVLEGPIKGEVSAHRRPRLDALGGVRVPITSCAQVHLRSETTGLGPTSMATGPRYPSPHNEAIYREISCGQGRSHHPGWGQEGDQKGWGSQLDTAQP